MAVDTNTKKLSLINFGLPWVDTLPEPSGDLDQGDRQHLISLYSGILAFEGEVINGPFCACAAGYYLPRAISVGFHLAGAVASQSRVSQPAATQGVCCP